jgi:hypothetical protein
MRPKLVRAPWGVLRRKAQVAEVGIKHIAQHETAIKHAHRDTQCAHGFAA